MTTTNNTNTTTTANVKTVNPETVKKLSVQQNLSNLSGLNPNEAKYQTYRAYLALLDFVKAEKTQEETFAILSEVFAMFKITLVPDDFARFVCPRMCQSKGEKIENSSDKNRIRNFKSLSEMRKLIVEWDKETNGELRYTEAKPVENPANKPVKEKKASKAKSPNKAEILAMLEEQKATNAALLAKLEAIQKGAIAA